MSDAARLPARPNIEHYRKRAKALVKAGTAPALTKAQFQIAREHGFLSWPRFAKHIEGLTRARSPISRFERAVDAIVAGDEAALARLLREDPSLVRARSTRDHRSTLLHYVSANGVEDFRQKTPANIVRIARRLLDAGADVNAESDAYAGHSTALNLTATSVHPFVAGVQNELLQLLLDRGARIDPPDVDACLANGRPEAAAFLAAHGAPLTLVGAAGVGRLDLVEGAFKPDGTPKRGVTRGDLVKAFGSACGYGHRDVARFLLDRGVDAGVAVTRRGETALHWAAGHGHLDIVRLLVEHGAPVHAKDHRFDAEPIGWALYGWWESFTVPRAVDYYATVAALVQAGATVKDTWLNGDDEFVKRVRGDERMLAALQGQST
jgi:ankyrin repeat protein